MKRVVLSSLGARQHFEPAAMLYSAGHLAKLVTDFWAPQIPAFSGRWLFKSINRMVGRGRADIPCDVIQSFPLFGIRYSLLQRNAVDRRKLYGVYAEEGERFARLVCRCLEIPHEVFFGFTSGSLESLKHEKEHGRWTVLDQIDPGPEEARLVRAEERAYPDFATSPDDIPERYFERIRAEWEVADVVLVNSRWSMAALIAEGVPATKIQIVPLPFRGCRPGHVRVPTGEKLRILFFGTLCLRKGVHYAVEAARRLGTENVSFTFAGPLDVNIKALHLPPNATYIGQVPRSKAAELFASHDVYLFPTLSDGFGLTQLEAMAYGLPVIATNCCGEVVEHGKSGFLVQARDPAAIAEAIRKFIDTRGLLTSFSEAALRRASDFLPENQWPLYQKALRLNTQNIHA